MDIAYAVGYLASDQAAFVTGAELVADGGFSVNGDAASDARRPQRHRDPLTPSAHSHLRIHSVRIVLVNSPMRQPTQGETANRSAPADARRLRTARPGARPAARPRAGAGGRGAGTRHGLAERALGTKDFAVLAGALGEVTSRAKIASGITHFGVRHPAVLASMAMTTQGLTGGRLVLGFGRSVAAMWKAVGLPPVTNQALIDSADILRRLCNGDKVSYDGPAGRFPAMRLSDLPDAPPPPLVLAAIGPKTLALAGAHFDGVLLHPFLTPEAVARSAATVRAAAEKAGRDPASVRVYATVVTASGCRPRRKPQWSAAGR